MKISKTELACIVVGTALISFQSAAFFLMAVLPF